MASCPNILGGGGEEEKSEGLCLLSLGVGAADAGESDGTSGSLSS